MHPSIEASQGSSLFKVYVGSLVAQGLVWLHLEHQPERPAFWRTLTIQVGGQLGQGA